MLLIIVLTPGFSFAIEKVDSLKGKLVGVVDNKEKVNTLLEISNCFLDFDLDSARYYADKAIRLAEKGGYRKEIAQAYLYKGIAEAIDCHSEKSRLFFERSLDIFLELEDKAGISKIYNNLGILSNMQGNLPEAIENYKKALSYYEADKDSIKMAPTLTNIGILYFDIEKYDLSLRYAHSAYNIFVSQNDFQNSAMCANNIGDVYKAKGDMDLAFSFYDKALQLDVKNQNNYGIGFELNSLGEVEFLRGNYKVALDYFHRAVKYRTDIKSQSELCETNINIGKTYYSMGDLNLAEQYCLKGVAVAEEIKDESAIRDGALVLSNVYEKLKKFEQALYFHQKYSATNDSIIKKNNLKKITQISAEYEFDKKLIANGLVFKTKLEKQAMFRNFLILFSALAVVLTIILYSRFRQKRKANITLIEKNTIISEQKEILEKTSKELKEVLKTKNKFFSIIAHDLRGPINGFLELSKIMADESSGYTNAEMQSFAIVLRNSADNVKQLLENLLNWARMQEGLISYKPEAVNLSSLIVEAIEIIQEPANEKKIEIFVDIEDFGTVTIDKNMLEIVLRNLVSNAVKFTPRGGSIRVSAQLAGNKNIVVEIEDSGIGMNKELVESLFLLGANTGRKGTEGELSTGLGLLLCKEFIVKLGGDIRVESEERKGSKFAVTIPYLQAD